MRQETVFRVAVLAAVVAGTARVLVDALAGHLRESAAGASAADAVEALSVVPAWVLLAVSVGGGMGIWFGILPTILAVAVWPTLESRLGTARAIPVASTLVAAVVMAEVLVSDWGWVSAFQTAAIAAGVSGYLWWLTAFVGGSASTAPSRKERR